MSINSFVKVLCSLIIIALFIAFKMAKDGKKEQAVITGKNLLSDKLTVGRMYKFADVIGEDISVAGRCAVNTFWKYNEQRYKVVTNHYYDKEIDGKNFKSIRFEAGDGKTFIRVDWSGQIKVVTFQGQNWRPIDINGEELQYEGKGIEREVIPMMNY